MKSLMSGCCFTNVSRALQDILSKFVYCRNRTSYENFKLKLWTCAQSHALGTRAKFQLEILAINDVVSGIVYFRDIIFESTRNVCETTPRCRSGCIMMVRLWAVRQVCSTPFCMVQCTYLITTGGTPHLYNRGSSMQVNSLHSGANDV